MPSCATSTAPAARGTTMSGDEIAQYVQRVLAAAVAKPSVQRREHQRVPYPTLIKLEPVDPATLEVQDHPVVVVGKHLSEQGIGFFHRDPMPHRFLAAVLELDGGTSIRLLINVSWCRFTRHGWYESGGKFIRVLEKRGGDVAAANDGDADDARRMSGPSLSNVALTVSLGSVTTDVVERLVEEALQD